MAGTTISVISEPRTMAACTVTMMPPASRCPARRVSTPSPNTSGEITASCSTMAAPIQRATPGSRRSATVSTST